MVGDHVCLDEILNQTHIHSFHDFYFNLASFWTSVRESVSVFVKAVDYGGRHESFHRVGVCELCDVKEVSQIDLTLNHY